LVLNDRVVLTSVFYRLSSFDPFPSAAAFLFLGLVPDSLSAIAASVFSDLSSPDADRRSDDDDDAESFFLANQLPRAPSLSYFLSSVFSLECDRPNVLYLNVSF
jgi:hypothetical protein